MKYVFQFTRILVFCILGELLHFLLPFPIPSGIYGLVLMLAALITGIIKPEQIQETATFLIGIFPLLFVPAATGVMELAKELQSILLPLFIAAVPITVLVMVVSGKTVEWSSRLSHKEDSNGSH